MDASSMPIGLLCGGQYARPVRLQQDGPARSIPRNAAALRDR
jgi:hypothetical protein